MIEVLHALQFGMLETSCLLAFFSLTSEQIQLMKFPPNFMVSFFGTMNCFGTERIETLKKLRSI